MSRYIEVDHLKKSVEELPDCYNGFSDTYDKSCIIGLIDEEPTADVVPVVRGEWARTADGYVKCSCCDSKFAPEFLYIFGRGYPKYCPFCGAKMGEVSE